MAALGRPEDWNRNFLVALRCSAILDRLGSTTRHIAKHRTRLYYRTLNAFGPIVEQKLDEILRHVPKQKAKRLPSSLHC